MKRRTPASRTSKLGLEELEPRIAPTSVVISDVPTYNWWRGCGPTAAGMILGYWDSNGYGNLVVGDASDTSGNLANIHDMIATDEHYQDYGDPSLNPDLSELGGAHANNCVADFMRTSHSYLSMSYGWSLFNYADNGLYEYAQYVGYSDADAWNEAWYSDSLWDNIVDDIDAGSPVMLLVDTDGNGNADHFITAIGYNDVTMEYACYNTWDSSVHWYDFALITADQPWAVYGATYFRPGTPAEPVTVEVDLALDPGSDTGISSTDGITSDNTPAFNVTVSDAGTISIDYDGDHIFDDVLEVDDAGTYQFELASPFSDGVHSPTVVFQPTTGNAVGDTIDITVDTVAPSAPVAPDLLALSDTGVSSADNITSDATPSVALTGFGDYYRLFRDGVQISDDYDTSSTFTEVSALADGNHTYTLRAVDSAGNVSEASSNLTVTVDTVAPDVPDTPDLSALSDTGISDIDDITTDATPTLGLSGFGTYHRLFRDGVQVSDDYDTSSSFTEGTPLADGTYTYSLRAVDGAGNVSEASSDLTVTVDTVAPGVPGVPDLNVLSDSGLSSTDDITNDVTPTLDLSGFGDYYRLYLDGSQVGDDYESSAAYTESLGLSDGVHTYALASVDAAGNVSAQSAPFTVTIDTVAPGVPDTPNLSPASDTGVSDTDDITSDVTPTLNLSGFGDYYRLFRDGVQVSDDYDTSGTFTEVSALADGNHTYTLRAVDGAGNVSEASSNLTVTVDTAAPTVPDVPDLNALSDTGVFDDDNITSDAEPTLDLNGFGTYYRLYRDGVQVSGDYATASSYAEGAALADGSYPYTLTAVDAAGNESDASDALTVVVDTLGPAVSDLTPEPGSIVMVSPTELAAVFNEVLDPTTVTGVNFQLVASGLDGTFDDGNETAIVPASVDYDEATSTATFYLDGELANDDYQITLVGTSTIEDLAGNALEGGGGDHVSTFTVGVPQLIVEDSEGLADDLYADFGFVDLTSGTATATVALANTGTAAVIIDSITVSDLVNYDIEWDGNGSEPTSIAADTQRVATITFDPAGLGAAPATITIESNDPTQGTATVTLDATAYVSETWTEGNTTVTLVDTAGDIDLLRDNVAVRFGRDGSISSIKLGGDLPMDGVGIIIRGASSVGNITDGRRGDVGDVAFVVCDAPVKNLRLNGSVSGHLLNGRTLEGVTFAADLDGDGDLHDQTAVWVAGDVRTLRVSGEVAGDVVVDGLVNTLQTTDALTGDLMISGNANNLRIGGSLGHLGGRVEIGGSLNRLSLSSKVGSADLLSDLSVAGEARGISVGSRTTGGAVFGDIEVGASVRSLTVAESLTGNVTVHGDVGKAAIGGQLGSQDTTFTVNGALKNLTVGSRRAPSDMVGDLVVIGDLSKASIYGDVHGQVAAEANVKNFTAQRIYSDVTVAGDLGSLRTASGILAGVGPADNLFSNEAGPDGSLMVAGEIGRLREA